MSNMVRGHVCRVTHPRSTPYSMARQKMHKNSIMRTRCVYNWTDMMVDMGLDKIVHHDTDHCNARIFYAWIKNLESDILRTRYKENEQCLLQKCRNLRFLDDEDNQTYMIAQIIWILKGPLEGISIIVWLNSSVTGGMGKMWTYLYQERSMVISWYSSTELNKTLIWG